MKRPAKIVLLLAIALLLAVPAAAIILAGCGESKHGDSGQDDTVQLEAGAQVSTGQTATASGDSVFSGTGLPIVPGRQLVYDSNIPGTPATVSFDLNGPWRFASGPVEATLTVAMVAKDRAPDQRQFGDASVAAATSWNSAAAAEYNFQSRDETSWYSYGRSFTDGRPTVTYSSRSRALVFPMSAGDSWVDVYTERQNGRIADVTAENRVLSRNELTVPAGTFNAWLLQTRVTSRSAGATTTTTDYSWFVPGVGRAAEIISQPGERDDQFSTAKAFYRLKSYK